MIFGYWHWAVCYGHGKDREGYLASNRFGIYPPDLPACSYCADVVRAGEGTEWSCPHAHLYVLPLTPTRIGWLLSGYRPTPEQAFGELATHTGYAIWRTDGLSPWSLPTTAHGWESISRFVYQGSRFNYLSARIAIRLAQRAGGIRPACVECGQRWEGWHFPYQPPPRRFCGAQCEHRYWRKQSQKQHRLVAAARRHQHAWSRARTLHHRVITYLRTNKETSDEA